jgi:predicted deacetylase
MTPAKFLVRFDDICPTMNWKVWNRVEKLLIDHGVQPIVAIVPDNQDDSLKVASPDHSFWQRARDWQRRGWTIAIHGYQHRYVTTSSGLVGLNKYSEFAGLTEVEQEEKLRKAMQIFKQQHIRPSVWVAPAHSFDASTLCALSRQGIDIISDGFAFRPYEDATGMRWVPQQMWRFRKAPPGIWTVCFHINEWKEKEIVNFEAALRKYNEHIIGMRDALKECKRRERSILDKVLGVMLYLGIRANRFTHPAQSSLILHGRNESFASTLQSGPEQLGS